MNGIRVVKIVLYNVVLKEKKNGNKQNIYVYKSNKMSIKINFVEFIYATCVAIHVSVDSI